MGRAKANVLPEPVGAWPKTSRPESASGTVAAWIGSGSVIPSVVRRSTTRVLTPRSRKEGMERSVRGGRDRLGPKLERVMPAETPALNTAYHKRPDSQVGGSGS